MPSIRSQTPGRTLKLLKQTGKRLSIARDRGRLSRLPGKRISRNNKVYWETRKNRSDAPFRNV